VYTYNRNESTAQEVTSSKKVKNVHSRGWATRGIRQGV